jgi:hypothetical protein
MAATISQKPKHRTGTFRESHQDQDQQIMDCVLPLKVMLEKHHQSPLPNARSQSPIYFHRQNIILFPCRDFLLWAQHNIITDIHDVPFVPKIIV